MNVKALFDQNAQRFHALYSGIDQSERYSALADAFRSQFSREPELFVSAPGRTEVVGNHTDHNRGRVLAAAVNLDTVAAVAARDDGVVTLYSAGYDRPFVVDLSDLTVHEDEKETTFALIRGVAARLKELGYRIGGFDASVTSTVFKGSGLSSSAAFEVMLVAAFDALYNGWTIDAKLNARISQYAENVFFGKPSGLLDQSASAVGGLVTMDFAPEIADVEALQYDFGTKGYAICVVSAGGEHGNLTADYASIPAEMKQVAQAMGVDVLEKITAEQLWDAVPMLKKQVSESSWKLLQNLHVEGSSNQEMPLALEMSRRMLEGRGAWRIHGGGFAGTILAFVPMDMLDEYSARMNAVFGEKATTALAIRPEGVVYFHE